MARYTLSGRRATARGYDQVVGVSGRRGETLQEREGRLLVYAGPSHSLSQPSNSMGTVSSLLRRRKHAPVTGDRGRAVAERDPLRDFNLVTDARLELGEPARELRAGVGAEGQSTSAARLDLVVSGECSATNSCDARVDTVAREWSVADPAPSP